MRGSILLSESVSKMLVLLPPSETKHQGGADKTLQLDTLSFADALQQTRERVLTALQELSLAAASNNEAAAAFLKALKLKPGSTAEQALTNNQELLTAPVLPAIRRYTGVLYDALDYDALNDSAKTWVNSHVAVQSALFGLVTAADLIPAYRLSGGSTLPGLKPALKQQWQMAHDSIDWAGSGFVLDLRSKDYVKLAALPAGANTAWLSIEQQAADGSVRALNHFNKAAKGELVSLFANSGCDAKNVDEFCEWALGQGLNISPDPTADGVLRYILPLR